MFFESFFSCLSCLSCLSWTSFETKDKKLTNIYHREESYKIQGAIFEVYREMGCGFLESVYQECLERELQNRDIPFIAQPTLQIQYKGHILKQNYKPDLICYNSIIIEIKALSKTNNQHKAQLMNYLKATNTKLGLLVNFGCYPKATVERIVL